MATQTSLVSITFYANADLSASQFRFVLVNNVGKVAVVAAAGGDADGVLQNKPAALDREAEVAVSGIAKVVCGAVVTAGDLIQSDNTGRAITAAAGDFVLGRAVSTTTAAGELVEVLLNSSHHLNV